MCVAELLQSLIVDIFGVRSPQRLQLCLGLKTHPDNHMAIFKVRHSLELDDVNVHRTMHNRSRGHICCSTNAIIYT